MNGSWLDRQRRRVGVGILAVSGAWLVWSLSPGLPVWRAPRARAEVRRAGMELFVHEWRAHDPLAHGDGLGPVFNATSCVSCHFQGGVGGGGGAQEDVVAFEALPTPAQPVVLTGLVHKFAVDPKYAERPKVLEALFPVVPKGVTVQGVCFSERRDFNPVHTQRINSIALFGAGWIDRISAKTIMHQRMRQSASVIGQELSGDFGSIPPGRPRILADGRLGKFGWKAQFATLEEFVAAACANELGLGTPRMPQAKPLGCGAPAEGVADLDQGQFRSLVAFVTTLPRPQEVVADDPGERSQVERGKEVFARIGCAACHTPELGGVDGVYSDFLLHRIVDNIKNYSENPDVPLPADHPRPEEWKTAPLWGVADSAPYFHDGGSPTLEAAIVRHEADAQSVTERYRKLGGGDREALHRFLGSLKAPVDAAPAPAPPRAPSTSPGESKGRLALAR
jgi:CxxC motif-containing protein (DUF1111 family)